MEITSLTLLNRARGGDESAWRRVVALYQPFLNSWFRSRGIREHDAEDLGHDVMAVLVRKLPDFEHTGRQGAFRTWLRTVAGNRAKKFFEAGRLATVQGSPFAPDSLTQLEDPASELSRAWDEEHDRYIFQRLFEVVAAEFEPQTVAVFRRLVFEECKPGDVAREFGMSVAAVYSAKSRLLARLRAEIAQYLE